MSELRSVVIKYGLSESFSDMPMLSVEPMVCDEESSGEGSASVFVDMVVSLHPEKINAISMHTSRKEKVLRN